jgi:hypothetical protein
LRQSSFSLFSEASLVSTASTSTFDIGALAGGVAPPAAEPGAAPGVAALAWPKMADMIVPKILICRSSLVQENRMP